VSRAGAIRFVPHVDRAKSLKTKDAPRERPDRALRLDSEMSDTHGFEWLLVGLDGYVERRRQVAAGERFEPDTSIRARIEVPAPRRA